MFYTSFDSSTFFRFAASSSSWDWHNCYIVSPGQGQEIFIISANPTANTLRIFSRGNNMFPEKTSYFSVIPIHWWKLISAIMQLFPILVKGMFGSIGKWALDDDSWKQLQIPAQKLTSKPSPHIANLVISIHKANVEASKSWSNFRLLHVCNKYCEILCSRLQPVLQYIYTHSEQRV